MTCVLTEARRVSSNGRVSVTGPYISGSICFVGVLTRYIHDQISGARSQAGSRLGGKLAVGTVAVNMADHIDSL